MVNANADKILLELVINVSHNIFVLPIVILIPWDSANV